MRHGPGRAGRLVGRLQAHGYAVAQVGQLECGAPVAAEAVAQDREQRRVLRDVQDRPVAQRPAARHEGCRPQQDGADVTLIHDFPLSSRCLERSAGMADGSGPVGVQPQQADDEVQRQRGLDGAHRARQRHRQRQGLLRGTGADGDGCVEGLEVGVGSVARVDLRAEVARRSLGQHAGGAGDIGKVRRDRRVVHGDRYRCLAAHRGQLVGGDHAGGSAGHGQDLRRRARGAGHLRRRLQPHGHPVAQVGEIERGARIAAVAHADEGVQRLVVHDLQLRSVAQRPVPRHPAAGPQHDRADIRFIHGFPHFRLVTALNGPARMPRDAPFRSPAQGAGNRRMVSKGSGRTGKARAPAPQLREG